MFLGGRGGVIGTTSTFNWASLDGRGNAPTGTPQYPTLFTGFGGAPTYPVRPPWFVSGVDYRAGVNTGVALQDPATISASIATTSGSNPTLLIIQQDNVTLNGYDFTLSGGYKIVVSNTANLTVTNSKFENLCFDASEGPITIQYCEFNGLGLSGDMSFGCLLFLRSTVTITIEYCWLYNAAEDFIDMTTQDITAKYNLFDTEGWVSGAHADAIQFNGAGTSNNTNIEFNTFMCSSASVQQGVSSYVDLETQSSPSAIMNNPVVAYNTFTNNFSGTPQASRLMLVNQTTGTMTNPNIHDNWADPNNTLFVATTNVPSIIESNNRLLTTGGIFTF